MRRIALIVALVACRDSAPADPAIGDARSRPTEADREAAAARRRFASQLGARLRRSTAGGWNWVESVTAAGDALRLHAQACNADMLYQLRDASPGDIRDMQALGFVALECEAGGTVHRVGLR